MSSVKAIESLTKNVSLHAWRIEKLWIAKVQGITPLEDNMTKIKHTLSNIITLTDDFLEKNKKKAKLLDGLVQIGVLSSEMNSANCETAVVGTPVYLDGGYYLVFMTHFFAGKNYPLRFHPERISDMIDYNGKIR